MARLFIGLIVVLFWLVSVNFSVQQFDGRCRVSQIDARSD